MYITMPEDLLGHDEVTSYNTSTPVEESDESQQQQNLSEPDEPQHMEVDPLSFIDRLCLKYDDAIIAELQLVHQSNLNCQHVGIAIGLSRARGYLPAISVSSKADATIISFMTEEWLEFMNILLRPVRPASNDTLISTNFTVKFGVGDELRYVHSRGQTIRLTVDLVNELTSVDRLLQYRLYILESLKFRDFYANFCKSVGQLVVAWPDIAQEILIVVLSGYDHSLQVSCMLECVQFNYSDVLNDIVRMY